MLLTIPLLDLQKFYPAPPLKEHVMANPYNLNSMQRTYNKWVANETLEDFALRFTALRARKWSVQRVANTALGIVSFLALEAIGGAITLSYGFTNAFYAISLVCLLIFITGIPICYFAAREGVDIDLLTRGAGFGYIGSTISSLIYASFTFIFFALEASIMSMAINILTDIPLWIAYIISSIIVIPLVTHGITRISIFQLWTQPIWIILQFVPFLVIFFHDSEKISSWQNFAGSLSFSNEFSVIHFGAAAAVIFPLMAQNAEQVDYLRFLPEKKHLPKRWWFSLIAAGPGWVVIGYLKLLFGSFLAVLAINQGVPASLADDPTHMYLLAFGYLSEHSDAVLLVTVFFVIISQLKINVTNAYAGSIAWSNFFSRVTHNHPGRVIWLYFNVCIALLLMELGLYQAFENILITYSALVLAWIGALVADLTINYWLGLRPKSIPFKRSELYDINPVGVLSMLLASIAGVFCQLGLFGEFYKALAPFIALSLPFITVPLIAYVTKGKYYRVNNDSGKLILINLTDTEKNENNQTHSLATLIKCEICENHFDRQDMTYCPFYADNICSLCCALDVHCEDKCRKEAHLKFQFYQFLSDWLPERIIKKINEKLMAFFIIFTFTSALTAIAYGLVFFNTVDNQNYGGDFFSQALIQLFFLLLILHGVLIWLYILANHSNKTSLTDAYKKAELLENEIKSRLRIEKKLQLEKDRADNANQAKTRYLSGVSHELRNPLNIIYGYAQLLQKDMQLPESTRKAAGKIQKNGEHLTDIIEGLLEISKIEARRVEYLHREDFEVASFIEPIIESFSTQAKISGLDFKVKYDNPLPAYASCDTKRLRQILSNLLSNAIKFTPKGSITFKISYRNQVAKFSVTDTGIGINQKEIENIFNPFVRVHDTHKLNIPGTGLGLFISKLLADLLGGEISVISNKKGTTFTLALLLPSLSGISLKPVNNQVISGFKGKRKTILVVDDEEDQRTILNELLSPIGFSIIEACDAKSALDLVNDRIDLLILDITMPDMSGWELLSLLRKKYPDMPVIMMSGNSVETQKLELENYKFDYYLIKPVEFQDLFSKLGLSLDIEWIYKNKNTAYPISDTGSELDADSLIIFPDKEFLEKIYANALIGNKNALVSLLKNFQSEQKDNTKYALFIKRINTLIESFNFPEIQILIKEHNCDK